jgi:hypothetical protein
MKKAIFPIIFITLFLFSATTEPSRFATPEEMGKALLTALKNNDSIRFLELYPSQKETNAAFVDPWKDSSGYAHQVQWAGRYFLDKSAMAREMFRKTRQVVIDGGFDWKDVAFVSILTRKETNRSPGIDYLYRAKLNLIIKNDYQAEIRLSDVMKTSDGWNCGLEMKCRTETPESRDNSKRAEEVARLMQDSIRMADSIIRVIYEKDKYEQEHKKKPHNE